MNPVKLIGGNAITYAALLIGLTFAVRLGILNARWFKKNQIIGQD